MTEESQRKRYLLRDHLEAVLDGEFYGVVLDVLISLERQDAARNAVQSIKDGYTTGPQQRRHLHEYLDFCLRAIEGTKS